MKREKRNNKIFERVHKKPDQKSLDFKACKYSSESLKHIQLFGESSFWCGGELERSPSDLEMRVNFKQHLMR